VDSELNEIITRVRAALDIGETSQMRPHLAWEAGQMVSHLQPDDLTTLELAALVAVLHAAHARVLGGPASSRPTLTIVPDESGSQRFESAG
jgi:hypothetical protein